MASSSGENKVVRARRTVADLMAEDDEGASPVETSSDGAVACRESSDTGPVAVDTTTAEAPGTTESTTSVILFGRTGCGKSTLAQMLTLGRLDPDSKGFVSSSSIRGHTKEVQLGAGRHWRVLDTPGFGEPKDKLSTMTSEEAEKKIRAYLQLVEGSYTHFLYVVMRDRIDELDKRLWRFFVRLCGASNIKTNFSVVISNACQEWLDENRAELQSNFGGCDSFLRAEFPTTRTDDNEWEAELQEVRQESLQQLEEELGKLERDPVKCDFDDGFWKMTSKHISSPRVAMKGAAVRLGKTLKHSISGVVKIILQINALMKELVHGDKILLPQTSSGHFDGPP